MPVPIELEVRLMRNPINELLRNMRMRTKILIATIVVVSVFMGLSLYQSLVIYLQRHQVSHVSWGRKNS